MKDQSVSRFWDNYIVKTKSYKIKSSVARYAASSMCTKMACRSILKEPVKKPVLPGS